MTNKTSRRHLLESQLAKEGSSMLRLIATIWLVMIDDCVRFGAINCDTNQRSCDRGPLCRDKKLS